MIWESKTGRMKHVYSRVEWIDQQVDVNVKGVEDPWLKS
jgi:hypothetical protein